MAKNNTIFIYTGKYNLELHSYYVKKKKDLRLTGTFGDFKHNNYYISHVIL